LLVDRTPTKLSRQQFQRHADELFEGGTKAMAEHRTTHGMPDLLASGHEGPGRAQLLLPPLPMFDIGDPDGKLSI
jgi:hypothetical protein